MPAGGRRRGISYSQSYVVDGPRIRGVEQVVLQIQPYDVFTLTPIIDKSCQPRTSEELRRRRIWHRIVAREGRAVAVSVQGGVVGQNEECNPSECYAHRVTGPSAAAYDTERGLCRYQGVGSKICSTEIGIQWTYPNGHWQFTGADGERRSVGPVGEERLAR